VLETPRLGGPAAFALVLALLAGGCMGTPSRPPSASSPVTSNEPSPESVPNPFRIVARFDVGLSNPVGLAIGDDGNLYVSDASQRVTVVSPGGDVIRRFGRRGNRPGEFSFVSQDPSDPTDIHASIAVGPSGDVYVSDSGNLRVQVFTPTGRFIRQFGASHDLAAGLLAPFDIVVDQDSNAYVADDQRGDLSKYSPTGRLEWRIGGAMSPDPDLRGGFHLATIDRHGRIVAAIDPTRTGAPKPGHVVYLDTDGAKVDAFGSNGEFPAGYGSCKVTVDAAGNTFVDSCVGGSRNLEVFDRSHRLIGAWYGGPFLLSPRFGPSGEVFTLGLDGEILKLGVALPDA
jgi:DNA-binding beta-propeller fold protein YncE